MSLFPECLNFKQSNNKNEKVVAFFREAVYNTHGERIPAVETRALLESACGGSHRVVCIVRRPARPKAEDKNTLATCIAPAVSVGAVLFRDRIGGIVA